MKIKYFIFFLVLSASLPVLSAESVYLECSVSGKYKTSGEFNESPFITISKGQIEISNSREFQMLEKVHTDPERYLAIMKINDGKYRTGKTYTESTTVNINRMTGVIEVNQRVNNSDGTTDGFYAKGTCQKAQSQKF